MPSSTSLTPTAWPASDTLKLIFLHRSTLVNLDRISEMRALDNGEYRVLLDDGIALKLSRNYRHALQRLVDGRSR